MVLGLLLSLHSSISYENPGIRLELLLKDLSSLSGESLHCPTTLKNEVLAASFQNQSIDIVKTQLARVIHGTWTEKEDGWWLVQTGEQQKEEREWNTKQRHDLLQMQIDGLKAKAPQTAWTAKDADKYVLDQKDARRRTGEGVWTVTQRRELRLRSPEARLSESLAAQFKPEYFQTDGLSQDFRRFSPENVPGHIQLPIDMSECFKRYLGDVELLQSITQTMTGGPETGLPAHVEIQVDSSEIPYFTFYTYDQNWRAVHIILAGFYVASGLRTEGENFALSLETQKLFDLERQCYDALGDGNRMRELRENPLLQSINRSLMQANTQDPLRFKQGACWIDFARQVHKPLLVNMEEAELTWRPKNCVPTWKETMPMIGMQRVDSDGWVLGRPVNPISNRAWRMDRKELEELTRLLNQKSPSIRSMLRTHDLFHHAAIQARGIPGEVFLPDFEWDAGLIAAFGSLTEEQENACYRGATIPIEQLPERGQLYLTDLASQGMLNGLSPLPLGLEFGYCPTYCLPNGIQGMRIGAKVEPDFRFSLSEDSEPLLPGLMAEVIKSKDFKPSTQFRLSRGWRVTVILSSGRRTYDQSASTGFAADSKTYTLETLPEDVKQVLLSTGD